MERRSSLANPEQWLVDWFSGGGKAASGVTVNETTALNATAVFSAVDILARTLASLPLPVYRRLQPRGKERAPDHPLYELLHDLPNPEMTSFDLRQALMGHLALWGNCFCEVERDRGGRVKALWPLRPDRMQVKRDGQGLLYLYRVDDGTQAGLRQGQVMHLRGLSSDGLIGYSPIRMAREAIGLALATEQFGAAFFGNGSRPGGVLQHPQTISNEASERLKKSWEEMHRGLTQAHRVAILEEGMTWQQVGIPPEDAQFLETRKFQVSEIARMFHVPPHMLADLDRSTNNNIEHQSIEFVVHTMRPWLVCWEQGIYRDLLSLQERRQYFAEFLVDGLLRGDYKSRQEGYAVGRQNGWLSANDIRELENMNPLPGDQGDTYLVPLNMVPADQAREVQQEPQPAPAARMAARLTLRRIEAAAVMKGARKRLGKGGLDEFRAWLRDWYEGHRVTVEDMTSAAYAERYIRDSVARLETVLSAASEEGRLDALQAEFDRWKTEEVAA